jgi:hypothetical protein
MNNNNKNNNNNKECKVYTSWKRALDRVDHTLYHSAATTTVFLSLAKLLNLLVHIAKTKSQNVACITF